MNIEILVDSIKRFGYEVTIRETNSLLLGNDRTFNFTWKSSYPLGSQKEESFTLFESSEIYSNDTKRWYNESGRSYYFYSFTEHVWPINIYRDDDLNNLFTDWYSNLSKIVSLQDLRDIRLSTLGI
jgi:hypothetical protein